MFSQFDPGKIIRKIFRGGSSSPGTDTTHSFNSAQEQEKAYESIKRGISMVPLEKIVGSVGRYHDFDRQFRVKGGKRGERTQHILNEMRKGKLMPPISLYQIKNDYFILDGHHRFKAAQELGYKEIRSQILELLPSTDTLENKLYIERTNFRDSAGLAKSIELTELGQFDHLEQQIKEHQAYLSKNSNREVSYENAAADWYNTIYKPLCGIIADSMLVDKFPDRTVDDLYLYISLHQWEMGKKRKYGIGIDKLIPKDMEAFRQKMAGRKEEKYPDMKKEVSVFILLNVDGRYEQKIFDKLVALEEVREVHSVHGSIDIVIKVTLVRDLLTSDAELLSQFITNTIRKWTGVVSTQTLIPGRSKIKTDDICYI